MKRSSLLFRIALSVTVLIFCYAGLSAQVTLKPPDWPIPGTLFGLHCHHVGKNGVWPSIQFYDLRLWDSFTDWPTLESQRGKWDFSNLDRAVDLAEQHKVELFLTLAWSPSWASARPNDKGHGPQGAVAEPKNIPIGRIMWRRSPPSTRGESRITKSGMSRTRKAFTRGPSLSWCNWHRLRTRQSNAWIQARSSPLHPLQVTT